MEIAGILVEKGINRAGLLMNHFMKRHISRILYLEGVFLKVICALKISVLCQ